MVWPDCQAAKVKDHQTQHTIKDTTCININIWIQCKVDTTYGLLDIEATVEMLIDTTDRWTSSIHKLDVDAIQPQNHRQSFYSLYTHKTIGNPFIAFIRTKP